MQEEVKFAIVCSAKYLTQHFGVFFDFSAKVA
jgi:hypothetical protein